MVYVQAGDLSTLMKTWLASPVRSRFYDSASFAAFQQSRVYLKLQDRRKDIENAIGVGLDESRLAELAGRASAVSIYDIGKLEIVFITEVPRARAIASALFKQAAKFEERSADGTAYYVHDVTTDGGRLNQQFCFAHIDGKLIVTTTEGLMIRAIANLKGPGGESLLPDVLAMAEGARGFAAHQVTMWLDQGRLNRNRYFSNYWIHRNAETELARIQNALIDLRMTRDGMIEQRWFKNGDRGQETRNVELSADQARVLLKFAAADAQLVRAGVSGAETLAAAIEETLFGKIPDQGWSPPEIPDRTRSASEDESYARARRYSRLDSRFDIDADDEQAPRRGVRSEVLIEKRSAGEPPPEAFVKSLSPILSEVSTGAYCELARSKMETGRPFVRFERAVVALLKPGVSTDRQALERTITDELRARFVVAGARPPLAWQEDGDTRFVAQSLLEQGAAYGFASGCLVLASTKEFAAEILRASKASGPADVPDGPSQSLALIRITAAKPVFDTLMSKLDGRDRAGSTASPKPDEEEQREIKFFSENLSSLIGASSIREARLVRRFEGEMLTERLVYSW
jgi:hypothetical protein